MRSIRRTDRTDTGPGPGGTHCADPRVRRGRRRSFAAALITLAAVAVLAGCTQDIERVSGPRTGEPTQSDIRLVRAENCDQLVATAEARERIARDRMERLEEDGQDGVVFDEGVTGSGTAGGAERSPGASMPATTMAPSPVAAPAAGPTDADPAAASDQSTTPKGDDTSGAPVIAGTNNQEQGVDEGDLVKTDGRRLVTLTSDGVLRVVVLDDDPAIDGSLSIDAPGSDDGRYGDSGLQGQLLLRDGDVVAVRSQWSDPYGAVTDVVRVDLTDPRSPRVIERSRVAGELVATRMIGRTVRIVVRPAFGGPVEPMPMPLPEPRPLPLPEPAPTAPAETTTPPAETTVPSTTVDTTTPPTAVTEPTDDGPESAGAAVTAEAAALLPRTIDEDGTARPLGRCEDVLSAPVTGSDSGDDPVSSEPMTTDMVAPQTGGVTVLTVGDTLGDLSPVTVDGGVETVYAATDALYTTSTVWGPAGELTVVHRFDLTGHGAARYTGSGLVPGMLLNQYSLSDRGGALRVVTTARSSGTAAGVPTTVLSPGDEPSIAPGEPGAAVDVVPPSTSAGRITVLRPDRTGVLAEVGHLDDLGVGEQVKSVRFLGDRAYVVTFRQTDPLFALDLSDDTAPRLLGELKIPGFSEYLHPIGDGRLLGIGSDADPATGRVTGFKASLFDVSDPTAPKELDALTAADMTSLVGRDPHAFTWDPVHSQAVVPVTSSSVGIADAMVEGPTVCPDGADCTAADGRQIMVPSWDGAWVLGVDGDRIVRRGVITHDLGPAAAAILRSVVIGDSIWTVSDAAVGRTPATAPDGVALLRF